MMTLFKWTPISLVLIIALLSDVKVGVSGLEIGEPCRGHSNRAGTCKLIYECAQAISDLKLNRQPVKCKTDSVIQIVCCPSEQTSVQPANNPVRVDTSRLRLVDRKCHEYSEYVYENVTYPVLVPGGSPITARLDKCGFTVVPLIVDGTPATPREFPHMAILGYGNNLATIRWGCGGTIISRRFVLTAAHCAPSRDKEPSYVRIGDLVYDSTSDDADPRDIAVRRVIRHPQYRFPAQYYDVALLELVHDMEFNKYARPACLNARESEGQRGRAMATGWGTTTWFGESSTSLLKVTLDFFRQDECRSSFPENRKIAQGILFDQQMCAGSYDFNKDTCEGDSGGPLQLYHESVHCMYNVVGITSFGKGCGNRGTPGIYVRVSHFVNWIEENGFTYG